MGRRSCGALYRHDGAHSAAGRSAGQGPRHPEAAARAAPPPDGWDRKRGRARWPNDRLIETDHGPTIICVTGGRVDYQVGEHVIHCGEGHFILLPPGVPYIDSKRPHYTFNPAAPSADDFCDLLWLTCLAHGIQCWTCHCRGAKHGSHRGQQCTIPSEAAGRSLDLLMEEAAEAQAGWQEICHDYPHAALPLTRREIMEGRVWDVDLGTEAQAAGRPHLDPIERAQQYIKAHLKSRLTIDSVARHVFMSRTRFIERFRQQTGQSFTEFLTQCAWTKLRCCSAAPT